MRNVNFEKAIQEDTKANTLQSYPYWKTFRSSIDPRQVPLPLLLQYYYITLTLTIFHADAKANLIILSYMDPTIRSSPNLNKSTPKIHPFPYIHKKIRRIENLFFFLNGVKSLFCKWTLHNKLTLLLGKLKLVWKITPCICLQLFYWTFIERTTKS